MPVLPPSSRLLRIFQMLATIVAFGIIITSWYIKDVHISVPTHFSWTRGGSYHPQEIRDIDNSANKSARADKFPFPKKIWQTGPSFEANSEIQPLVATWQALNPNFRYELLSDKSAERYVKDNFADKPDIMEAYFDVSDIILRADLLRLLIMSASGGVYTDLDTKCLIPVTEWVPERFHGKVQLVVGVEVDLSQDDVPDEEKKGFQLCQWTLLAMPGSKHLAAVVDYIISRIRTVAEEKGIPITELGHHVTVPEVISITGPKAFTKALFKSLSKSLGERFTARNLSALRSPLLVDDVLFLPVNAFGGYQTHSHSGETEYGPVFLRHYFRSSWWAAKEIKIA